jgi:hypothetical protein
MLANCRPTRRSGVRRAGKYLSRTRRLMSASPFAT